MRRDLSTSSVKKAFTLVELLLYISIVGVVLFAISTFLFIALEARIKNQAISEVESQGVQVMQIISQAIREAEGVNIPVQGTNDAIISLDAIDVGNDPTIINLSGGSIWITEGTGASVVLTNSKVIASGLNFFNLSRANSPEIIRIQFSLAHVNPEGRQEYEYSKLFTTSVSLH